MIYYKLEKDDLEPLYLKISSEEMQENSNSFTVQIEDYVGPFHDYKLTNIRHDGHILAHLSLGVVSKARKTSVDPIDFEERLLNSIAESAKFIINKESELKSGEAFAIPTKYNVNKKDNFNLRVKLYQFLKGDR